MRLSCSRVVVGATVAAIISVTTPSALAQIAPSDVLFLDGFEPPVVPVLGDLRINEVMPDPALPLSDTEAEWIEIFSTAARTVSLTGCELRDAGGGSAALTGIALPSSTFLLAARSSDGMVNGGLQPDITFGFTLNNVNETVAVYCGGVLIDQLGYTASIAGRSIFIDTDGTQCNAPVGGAPSYAPNNFGTPGRIHSSECP